MTAHEVFRLNNTAHMVMGLLQASTLDELLRAGEPLPAAQVSKLAMGLCETLTTRRPQGVLHREIKPANIMIVPNRGPVLIDFATGHDFTDKTGVIGQRVVMHGYAPLTQYADQAKPGPQADIYGLGETLHHAHGGDAPPSAPDRGAVATLLESATRLGTLPRSTSDAIIAALAICALDEPTTAEFWALLSAGVGRPPVIASCSGQVASESDD